MDPRVILLKNFSNGFIRDKAKIETEQFGFDYLERLLSGGSRLEYGDLTTSRVLHKYKMVDIPPFRMDELLHMHIMKECNVCRYFGSEKNDVFCFNMDNNHKTNNTVIIPELSLALATLRQCLLELDCEPLIVASGRGYHVWLRLTEPLENKLLYDFMVQAAARALLPLLADGYDRHAIKFRFYPDIKVNDVLSLRLFGSDHALNNVFSRVSTPDALLGEEDSWKYFERFVQSGSISTMTFRAALDTLLHRA